MMPDKDLAEDETSVDKTVKVVKASPPWPLITIGVFATVVIVAVMIGGWVFVRQHESRPMTNGRMGMMSRTLPGNSDQFGGGRGGFRRSGGMMQKALANGVVTAVNGDSITVSGRGKQVTVKKTSSTVVSGDKTDATVNDTVLVYGSTESDGTTIDATRIVVRNLTHARGTSDSSVDDPSDAMTPGA